MLVAVPFVVLLFLGDLALAETTLGDNPLLLGLLLLAVSYAAILGSAVWLTDGRTVGKAVFGLRVRRAPGRDLSGRPSDLLWAVGRHSWGYLVVDVGGVGVLAALVTRRRRCWHDLAFHSEVVVDALAPDSLEDRGRAFAEWLDEGRDRARKRYGWVGAIWTLQSGLIRKVATWVFAIIGAGATVNKLGFLDQLTRPSAKAAGQVGDAPAAVSTKVTSVVWFGTAAVMTAAVVAAAPGEDYRSINVVHAWGEVGYPTTTEIRIMRADGSEMRELTDNDSYDGHPDLFADERIVFVSDRDGDEEIYRMNADGSAQTRLTTSPGTDNCPAWSPDGDQIAFRSDRTGASEIFVMTADGSDLQQLTTDGGNTCPDWAPDGARIVYASASEDGSRIRIQEVDGGGVTDLTGGSRDLSPSWSPDGDHVAFTRERNDNWDVYVVAADGGNPVRLSSDPADDRNPFWGPNSDRVLFSSERGFTTGASEFWAVRPDGSDLEQVTRYNQDE